MGRNDGGVLNNSDTLGNGGDLYHFGNSSSGFRPFGGVIKASDGKLYGTASIGGTEGSGVLFSMNTDGTGYTVLKRLSDAEGYGPSGKLLEASDGKLYGACRSGGALNNGCIFRIDKNGNNFQVIYSYSTYTGGFSPVGGLIEDNTGILYGVNIWASGSVFRINKDGSGYTELKLFEQGTPGELFFPYNGVITDGDYLYGAAGYGGSAGKGGLFRIKKDDNSYQVLHEFNGTDGELPVGSLLLADNGKLYGTTAYGGSNNLGSIFRIETTGSNFTTLRDLSDGDGTSPWTGLIQASDGLIYGGTQTGGAGFGGTLFKMDLNGSGFAVIRDFNFETEGQGVQSLIDLNGNFNPLPVQFITFTAQKTDQGALLSWQTATEQNSDYFEVERSTDGIGFASIGRVRASGNSNHISSYSFTDRQFYNGTNFYRLKEVDLDGTFSYSKLVSVKFNESAKFRIAPNPVVDHLIIKFQQGNPFTSASIFDISGRLVRKQNTSGEVLTIDVHQLSKGWYVLKLKDRKGNEETTSFIKE